MEIISYSLIAMLLHSIWQAALFYFIYRIAIYALQIKDPYVRRNGLLLAFPFLFICSLLTFLYYTFNVSFTTFGNGNDIEYLLPIDKSTLISYSPFLLSFYCLFILIKGNKILFTWRKYKRNGRDSLQKAPAAMRLFTKQAVHLFGIKKNVQVWLCNKVVIPCTMGFLKPVILFPAALAASLTTDEIETILLHELAHIRQKDYLLNWLILFAETIYFFNPFIYIISRQAKLEREKSCDLQVLHFGYNQVTYATALLKTAKFNQQHFNFQLAASSNKPFLLKRIHFFTGYNYSKQGRRNFIFPLAFLSLTAIIALLPFTKATHSTNDSMVKTKIIFPSALHHSGMNEGEAEAITVKNVETNFKNVSTDQIKDANSRQSKDIVQTHTIKNDEDEPTYNQSLYIPVSLTGHSKDSAREVVVREQTSAGITITKCYKVSYKNDEWNLTLLWIATEKIKNIKDSLITNREHTLPIIDSNINRASQSNKRPIVDLDL
ncbi:MAG: M56 family metallopeptidase [Niastella sp.]|nr:M56 family metallopeptidase [Niastella sp.]